MNEQVKNETIHSGVCAAVLLIIAFTQWPYFMYLLFRVFICGSSAYIASKLYSRHRVPLTWLFGAIAVLFNPVIPIKMARSDWQAVNLLTAIPFIGYSIYLNWEGLSQRRSRRLQQSRIMVRAVAAICTRMKGHDIRILELTPTDSALADFSVVTSAISHLQATAIADEVELRLKNDWGLIPISDNRNVGWILLDYADFTVHIFLAEQRAFYDIEGSRKSAKSFIPAEFNSPMKH
jgi:ribosome silencing factor RsfS/YbeB/iojap